MSFFSDLYNYFQNVIDAITSSVSDVLNVKGIAQDEFVKLLKEFDDATSEFDDIEDKIKHLKTKAIRADLVFKLFNDIRTGKLRDLLTDDLKDVKTSFLNLAGDAVNAGKGFGAVKASGLGGIVGKVISWIQAVGKAWSMIAIVTHFLRSLVPIIQKIHDELKDFEKIIMSQKKKEISVDGPHRTRKQS